MSRNPLLLIHKTNINTSDKWTYYFDSTNFKVIANKVVTSNHISLVENITFDKQTDFVFNEKRKSYRVDKLGNKIYLRAEYFYSDFDITFRN